jgi:hypothetical protein
VRLREAGRAAVEAQSWETVIARFERDLEEVAGVEPTSTDAIPILA